MFAWRRAVDGRLTLAPATAPIWTQEINLLRSSRPVSKGMIAQIRQVCPRDSREPHQPLLPSPPTRVRPCRRRRRDRWCHQHQARSMLPACPTPSSGRKDGARPEVLGDLNGKLSSRAGGTENQDGLSRREGDPVVQGDPRGHTGIHCRSQHDRICRGRKRDAATAVNDGVLGHRFINGVGKDEIYERAVGAATNTVDSGNER